MQYRKAIASTLAGLLLTGGLAACGGATNVSKSENTSKPPATEAPATTKPAAPSTIKPPATTSQASTDPATVVRDFYDAINANDYNSAWDLGGKNFNNDNGTGFGAFVNGYSTTSHVAVTITGVSGNKVSMQLVATQTDGSTKTFEGTYTVSHGELVSANIRELKPPAPPKAEAPSVTDNGDGSVSRGFGSKDATADVKLSPIRYDDLGMATMYVTVTNHSSERSDYYIEVRAIDRKGIQADSGNALLTGVAPGAVAKQYLTVTFLREDHIVRVELSQVQRTASS